MSLWGPDKLSPEQKKNIDELVIKFIALRELLKKHPKGGAEVATLLYEKVHVFNELQSESLLNVEQKQVFKKFFALLPEKEEDMDARMIQLLIEVIDELVGEFHSD